MKYQIYQGIGSKYDLWLSKDKIVNRSYTCLISNKNAVLYKKKKGEKRLQIEILDDIFLEHFAAISMTTICTKFRDFQFRLLHNQIVTNQKLKVWKIITTDKCTFCDYAVETTLHLFCECVKVKELWDDLNLYISTYAKQIDICCLEWTDENIMFNHVHPKRSHVINFLILIAKQYIYRQRCAGRALYSNLLFKEIETIYNLETSIANSKLKSKRHVSKWSRIYQQLASNEEDTNGDNYIDNYLQSL